MTVRRLTAAAAALLAGCTELQAPGAGEGALAAGDRAALVRQMAQAVNAHRRAARCPDLLWLPSAANAAQAHSDDMARRRYFNHQSPEGRGPADRLREHGVGWRAMGENIARHHGAPREVLAGWVASTGHRQNLERCTYTHHGIGWRNGLWTHLFVTPATPPRPAGT